MATPKSHKLTVDAPPSRSTLGKLLKRVEQERQLIVINDRGLPKAVLLSFPEYIRLAAPAPAESGGGLRGLAKAESLQ